MNIIIKKKFVLYNVDVQQEKHRKRGVSMLHMVKRIKELEADLILEPKKRAKLLKKINKLKSKFNITQLNDDPFVSELYVNKKSGEVFYVFKDGTVVAKDVNSITPKWFMLMLKTLVTFLILSTCVWVLSIFYNSLDSITRALMLITNVLTIIVMAGNFYYYLNTIRKQKIVVVLLVVAIPLVVFGLATNIKYFLDLLN
jgi:hypothetical protein